MARVHYYHKGTPAKTSQSLINNANPTNMQCSAVLITMNLSQFEIVSGEKSPGKSSRGKKDGTSNCPNTSRRS
ncbi:hypothetical protein J6590_025270 [Homalodisca vitripennis]|nr:hypothetical protein J6590_025270 [Homalodisca vitripennis]